MGEEEAVTKFVEAMMAPLHDVGALLAKALDDTNAEVAELKQHVQGLQRRVAELEARFA